MTIASDPGDDDTYEAGDVITVHVFYGTGIGTDLTIDTTGGTPRLPLTIGSATRYAAYSTDSRFHRLNFEYTVQAGDNDADGIGVPGPIDLNGGTIQETGTTNNAPLTLGTHAITNDAEHKVATSSGPTIGISTAAAAVTEGDEIAITVTRGQHLRGGVVRGETRP